MKKQFSFKEFINNYIIYEPLYPESICDPEQHSGLAVATFPKVKGKQLNIECCENREIYCEIVDYKDYVAGEIIPIGENKQRHIIINYAKLENDNDAKKISDIINRELKQLYCINHTSENSLTLREEIEVLRYQNLMLLEYIRDLNERIT